MDREAAAAELPDTGAQRDGGQRRGRRKGEARPPAFKVGDRVSRRSWGVGTVAEVSRCDGHLQYAVRRLTETWFLTEQQLWLATLEESRDEKQRIRAEEKRVRDQEFEFDLRESARLCQEEFDRVQRSHG